jgi:hypothetical protein
LIGSGDALNVQFKGESAMVDEHVKIAEEMQKMEEEPLLPVEKKLIAYSIALGVILLGILIFISYRYFPG